MEGKEVGVGGVSIYDLFSWKKHEVLKVDFEGEDRVFTLNTVFELVKFLTFFRYFEIDI